MKPSAIFASITAALVLSLNLAAQEPSASPSPEQTPPADPPKKQITPEGVFFVLERLSTVTDSGVASAMPGTKVKLVRAGNPMRVTDGRYEYEAAAYQLTKDVTTGQQLKERTESARQMAGEKVARITSEYEARKSAPLPSESIDPRDSTATGKKEQGNNDKEKKAQKIEELRAKIKDLRQEILDRGSRGSHTRRWKKGEHDSESEQSGIIRRNRQIDDLKEQIRKLGGNAAFD